jgi:ribokinase
MSHYHVITIGSATRDVYLKSPAFDLIKSEKFVTGVGECLALGSKNEASEIFLDTGGGGTNTAVTFGNLKLKTAVLTRVGNDESGNEVIRVLKKAKVDTSMIQRDKKHFTSYSTLLLTGTGHRSVLVYRGASNFINWEEAPQRKMKTKWFYITSLGGNIKLLKKIFDFAKKKKTKIAWNPGGAELKLGVKKLQRFIKNTEVFNVNREEASELVKVPFDNLNLLLKKMSKLGAKIKIVTDGEKGAYAFDGKEWYFAHSLGTKPLNTTGAGDAFGSGFVAGLILCEIRHRPTKSKLRGNNCLDYALRLATLNADGVIRKMGAKNGLLESRPRQKELKRVKITFFNKL